MNERDREPAHVWPPHHVETLAWHQQARGGTRADRMLDAIEASVPPFIATLEHMPSSSMIVASEDAVRALAGIDAVGTSPALGRFMMRTESVASSKIERITASTVDFARALAGRKANASATSMVAAGNALQTLVARVGETGEFSLESLLEAHRDLMVDDPVESAYAGRLRDMQNWIGGSDHSPRDALYVPPAPGRVPELLDDLLAYLARDDVPVMVQAAIAHAQFESIHVFTDGNGRIGRALVSAVLRRRGIMRNTVVPIASGILAVRDDYFAALGDYRRGDPTSIVELFVRAARVAAEASGETVDRLAALPEEWIAALVPRAGSAVSMLIRAFHGHPVMNAEELETHTASSVQQTYKAVDRLVDAGIVQEITGRKRDRAWAASEVLAELDDLDRRIRTRMTRG